LTGRQELSEKIFHAGYREFRGWNLNSSFLEGMNWNSEHQTEETVGQKENPESDLLS
jgi:hypothetical protein